MLHIYCNINKNSPSVYTRSCKVAQLIFLEPYGLLQWNSDMNNKNFTKINNHHNFDFTKHITALMLLDGHGYFSIVNGVDDLLI